MIYVPLSSRRRRERPRSSNGRGNRFRPRLEALEERALLSVYTVDRLTDLGEGDGLAGDLRYVITQANAVPGDDIITFAVTGTINLSSALPNLSSNIDLQGPGAGLLTVRRNTGFYRIFGVTSSATVVLSGLTITNGFTTQFGCGIGNDGTLTLNNAIVTGNSAPDQTFGGGIYNSSTLTLNNSTVSDNDAGFEGFGGGIYNEGTVALNNSTVSGNLAHLDGGGISNYGGTLTLNNSTVSGNSVGFLGGGIYNGGGTLTLNNSTVSGNSSRRVGGGISNGGMLTLNNSTVSGNSSSDGGGGISNGGTLTLNNSTVSGNDAGFSDSGGGILNDRGTLTLNNSTVSGNRTGNSGSGGGIHNGSSGTVALNNSTVSGNSTYQFSVSGTGGGIRNLGALTTRNTILAGNTAATAPDLSGSLGSQGHNLIGNTSGGSGFHETDLLDVDPLLGPLDIIHGGPTLTHALLPGSPALDAGDPAGATSLGFPKYDQRGPGFARIAGGRLDIGAFEVQTRSRATFAMVADEATVPAGIPVGFYVVALDAYGHVVTGYVGEVAFASSDPEAALPAAYTFQASAGGIAYFADGVTFATAGPQALYVFDTATYEVFGYAVREILEP